MEPTPEAGGIGGPRDRDRHRGTGALARRLAWNFASVFAFLTGMVFGAETPDIPTKRVLLITTGSSLASGFNTANRQILQALTTVKSARVETYAENLDIVRFPSERSQLVFRKYLGARYAGSPPDLVVLVFAGSLGQTANSLAHLFPGTPILAAGFTQWQIRPDELGELVTGFIQRSDPRGALDLIVRLHPQLRRVVVIGGSSEEDGRRLQPIRAAAAAYRDTVAVEFWDNRTVGELRRAVTAMPPDTAILYLPMFQDASGQTVIAAEVGHTIGELANVPVYLMIDGSLGTGAVGGKVSTLEAFGKRTGEMAVRLLEGTPPASMPFEVRADSVPIFDWRALRRWNISEDALPAGSVIRFKPQSLWREYAWYIGAALAVIMLLAATIAALLFERRYRRRISTERKQTEFELRQQRRELAHVGRVSLIGEMAASLAHELSQPLTAIRANTHAALRFLKQGNAAESQLALEDVLEDQDRASEIVRNTRRFVKKDSASPFAAIDLADVIADVVALARSDAASQRVEVVHRVEGNLPAIMGDSIQLQQVLLNLLLNAFSAMRESANNRTVTITAQSGNGMVRVAVSDHGHGLPAGDIGRVFEAFYTTKAEGLGMGLAICRAIVHAHGGNMWAGNNEGGGATFNFTVPMASAQARPAAPPVAVQRNASSAAKMESSPPKTATEGQTPGDAKVPATLGDVLYKGTSPAIPERDWVALIASIASGEQMALHALYDRCHRLVFTLAVRITGSRETAEEVTLDVFHDVWRRAAYYSPSDGTVLGWIMNQARSRSIDSRGPRLQVASCPPMALPLRKTRVMCSALPRSCRRAWRSELPWTAAPSPYSLAERNGLSPPGKTLRPAFRSSCFRLTRTARW